MDANLLFGIFALLFGLTTLAMRVLAPGSKMFAKLEPMKERFGDRAGIILHVTAYTVTPIVAGLVILAAYARQAGT